MNYHKYALSLSTMEHIKKQNRSKYNFGLLEKVGDYILVEPEDVYSALSSLGAFNRRHGTSIVLAPADSLEGGKIKLEVKSI